MYVPGSKTGRKEEAQYDRIGGKWPRRYIVPAIYNGAKKDDPFLFPAFGGSSHI